MSVFRFSPIFEVYRYLGNLQTEDQVRMKMREKYVYRRIYWNLTEILWVSGKEGVDSGVLGGT